MDKKTIYIIIGIAVFIALIIIFKKSMFKKVIGFIIQKNEGGFSTDRQDSGNWTGGKVGVGEFKGSKYGISAAAFPNLDIKNLTLDQAENIYYDKYFSKLPTITDINLLYQVLDMAINAGVGTALKLYKPNMTLAQYKQARINEYRTYKNYPIYGRIWEARVNKNII